MDRYQRRRKYLKMALSALEDLNEFARTRITRAYLNREGIISVADEIKNGSLVLAVKKIDLLYVEGELFQLFYVNWENKTLEAVTEEWIRKLDDEELKKIALAPKQIIAKIFTKQRDKKT